MYLMPLLIENPRQASVLGILEMGIGDIVHYEGQAGLQNAIAQQEYYRQMLMQQNGYGQTLQSQQLQGSLPRSNEVPKQEIKKEIKKESYMRELIQDVRNFIKEHRGVIYTVTFIVLLDHFVLGGQFREKLKEIASKLLRKAEDKLHAHIDQK